MKATKKLVSILLSLVILLSVVVTFPVTVSALESTGNSVMDAFINDARWTHGISWGYYQRPKVSPYDSIGCCAYTADFAKYCFGKNSPRGGAAFYNADEARAGDVIHVSGHWFAILKRSGNSLYVAEGNCDSRVRIGWTYTIGYNSFNGRHFEEGFHFLPAAVTITRPSAPSNVSLNKSALGRGDSLVASWAGVSGANSYTAKLICTTNSAYNQTKTINGTSAAFVLDNEGSYYVSVCATNSAGSSGYTNSGSGRVFKNNTVTWEDYDGTVLKTQSVKYNGNATPPAANPTREGYTFQGWDKGYNGITSDTTIKATYKINVYSVSFVDYKGDTIGNVQRIEYNNSATPPTNIPAKPGYIFTDWNTSEFKEVKKNLIVKATYEWENPDLPIILDITSAARNEEATGYDIKVKMSNFPDSFTKGKLVVSLRTKDGKMVAVETHSISMPKEQEITEEVTVLYSGIVSTVEASMVGIIDDEATGSPKSTSDVAPIDIGNEWSDWSINVPSGDDIITDSRKEYRYKDSKTIKATSQPATPAGYTFVNSAKTGTYTNWGSWTGWSTASQSGNALKEVQTTTGYRYYVFRCTSCGSRDPYSGSCMNCGRNTLVWDEMYHNQIGGSINAGDLGGKGKAYINGTLWYYEYPGSSNGWTGTGQPTCTMYRYRTRQEYINYNYIQSSFSAWQTEAVSASSTREVETRTVYRFKTNSAEVPCYNYKRYKYTNLNNGKTVYTYSSSYPDSVDYPGEWEYFKSFTQLQYYSKVDESIDLYNGVGEESWYKADVNNEGESIVFETSSTLEDTEGVKRHVEGTLENDANKVVTLIVYKGKNNDPTANQIEYISQKRTDANGFYSFDFITKEEPTLITGDFIIGIGVEGGTEYIEIDRIKAPKPVYVVDFVDEDGTLLKETNVVEGGIAEAPEDPEKSGYEFVGWDTALNNIQENMVVTAVYRENKCMVVFVDWDESFIDIKEFPYGSQLSADSMPEREGKRFAGWVDSKDNDVLVVKGDMVVTAKYEDAKYTVTFFNSKGEVIKESVVGYGESVAAPETTEAPSAKQKFLMWDSEGAEDFVTRSLAIRPIFTYTENTSSPRFTVDSGTYNESQTVGIYSISANSKIYYYVLNEPIDELETFDVDKDMFSEYEEPIVINETSTVFAYAATSQRNDSDVVSTIIKLGNETPDGPTIPPTEVPSEPNDNDPNVKALIKASSTKGSNGKTVNVDINLSDNPGIVAMTLKVSYNTSALTLVDVKDAGVLGSASHKPEKTSPYTLSWANDTATTNYTVNGTIATLSFKINDNADIGKYPITVTYDYNNYGIYDKDLSKVKFNVENGTVEVIDFIYGDVDSNGIVNNLDRVILTRYLANWNDYQTIDNNAADVDCNGTVNNLDRVILTRYLANWSAYSELPHRS